MTCIDSVDSPIMPILASLLVEVASAHTFDAGPKVHHPNERR